MVKGSAPDSYPPTGGSGFDSLTAYHAPILAMGIFLLLYYSERCLGYFKDAKAGAERRAMPKPGSRRDGR